MERAIIALCFTLSLFGIAHADQFNDAFFGEPPDFSAEISSGAQISNGGSTTGGGSTGGGSGAPPTEGPPADSGQGSASDSPGSGSGNGSTGGTSSSGSGIETEEELLILLVSQGALQIDGGSGLNSSFFGTVLDGVKMRAAYKNDPDIAKVLRYWKGLSGEARQAVKARLTTGEYYALLATELAGDDERLEKAALSASRFELRYRSRGELFAIIPWSFPVQIEVTAAAEAAEAGERVAVRLPWYRWFVRKYFSARGLEGEIEALVAPEIARLGSGAEDIQAVLLRVVADYVRQKMRTISDSVLLGT